jgi:hypothetical protein
VLVERATSGDGDAPLAAYAIARRTGDAPSPAVESLLGSADPLLRAHAFRGLAASASPSAVGRLADAYAWEIDAGVRRALVAALASIDARGASEVARRALATAARLDPDTVARWIAAQALAKPGNASGGYGLGPREIAWLRAVPAETSAPSRAAEPLTGLVATSDGRAVPIVFDEEGYALVPGVAPGEASVRLAPRLPPYSTSQP